MSEEEHNESLWSEVVGIIINVVCTVIGVAIFIYFLSHDRPSKSMVAPNLVYETVGVSSILKDFDENPIKAQDYYIDKYFKIIGGRVSRIESDEIFAIEPLDESVNFKNVWVGIMPDDTAQKDTLHNLKKGQLIIVYGRIQKVIDNECVLVLEKMSFPN